MGEFITGMFAVSNCLSRSNLKEICSRAKLMPTSLTTIASSSNMSFKSVSKIAESDAEMDALNVERSIKMAFAPLLRMFVKKAFAVQSSGSVIITPMFAVFGLFGVCIFG